MSTLVEFSMPFDHDLATTYFTAGSGMSLNESVYSVYGTFVTKTSGSQAWATLNDTAKNLLFPNGTAHPVSMSYKFSSSRPFYIGSAAHALYLQISGTTIANTYGTSTSHAWATGTDATSSAITNATKSSEIRFGLETSNKSCRAMGCSSSDSGYFLSFKFMRYDFAATAGECVSSASVSSSTGFDGDTVTYSCELQNGAEFLGWYIDRTLVSTSRTYAYTVDGSDLNLVARAHILSSNLSASYGGKKLFTLWGEYGVKTITYDNTPITTISIGETKTLHCAGKVMKSDVKIAGKTLRCAGKTMSTDVVVTY